MPRSPDIPIPTLREAAQRAVDLTSLRQVADAAKLSPSGLRNFLDGSRPYTSTVRKLTRWYVAHRPAGEPVPMDVASAALGMLLDGLPDAAAECGRQHLVEAVRRVFDEAGVTAPGWVMELGDDPIGGDGTPPAGPQADTALARIARRTPA